VAATLRDRGWPYCTVLRGRKERRFYTHEWFKCGAPAPKDSHTFVGDDDLRLFRADENSQSATSFPESATSLQSVVPHHVTHATQAAIRKEDSGGISHCEHSLSSRLSSLRTSCVPAPRDTYKISQRRRFKLRRPHQPTHTHTIKRTTRDGSNYDARTSLPHTHYQERRFKSGRPPSDPTTILSFVFLYLSSNRLPRPVLDNLSSCTPRHELSD